MKKYKILEHTADLKIEVYGKNKKDLFSNAFLAMMDSFRSETKNKNSETRIVKVRSSDLETLLVDFLSKVLYLTQVNREIYNNIKFSKFSDKELEIELFGEKVERFGLDIKAVTYHNLDVSQKKDGSWKAVILFDI